MSPREQRYLQAVQSAARDGTIEALESVGLFARTPDDITARRAEFTLLRDLNKEPGLVPWLLERFRRSQWLGRRFFVLGVVLVLMAMVGVLKLLPQDALLHLFGGH